MKWSEQMRVLNSEDEHYNQLKFNVDTKELLINEEVIAKPVITQLPIIATSVLYRVSYEDYIKIRKKYPFFTDVKFLLNCIFKKDYYFIKASEVYYYAEYIVIQNSDSTNTLVIYTVPQVTP